MYHADSALPHLLPTSAYFRDDFLELEKSGFLNSCWHLVGTRGDLSQDGDFLTTELLGHPIQIRNFGGELRALSNVCAHRHCLLTSQARGRSATMRCQYHGWEYGPGGKTRSIPEPDNFRGMAQPRPQLARYRLQECGQLLFVSLDQTGPSLKDQLGGLYELCRERFELPWVGCLDWSPSYDANWKVPVENSLEAYHVQAVHPRTFGRSPAEENTRHLLAESHTALETTLPFAADSRRDRWMQRLENSLVAALGHEPTASYRHHHIFPNLLFSFTDAVSVCQCVVPVTATTSRACVRQFGRVGSDTVLGPLSRLWGFFIGKITRHILEEDRALFHDIQRGLEASPHRGVLGRCEERVHAFQQELLQRLPQEGVSPDLPK